MEVREFGKNEFFSVKEERVSIVQFVMRDKKHVYIVTNSEDVSIGTPLIKKYIEYRRILAQFPWIAKYNLIRRVSITNGQLHLEGTEVKPVGTKEMKQIESDPLQIGIFDYKVVIEGDKAVFGCGSVRLNAEELEFGLKWLEWQNSLTVEECQLLDTFQNQVGDAHARVDIGLVKVLIRKLKLTNAKKK